MSGLSRPDMQKVVWQGAVPASLLALVMQGAFELAELAIATRGLRLGLVR